MSEKYIPNDEIMQQLKPLSFMAIIGPSSVGKNTIIEAVITDSGALFHRVLSHTTRGMGLNETDDVDYVFEKGNVHSRRQILARKESQELVQIFEHPTRGHLYWTEIEDWIDRDKVSLMDTLSGAYDALYGHGFKKRIGVYVVCSPASWNIRMAKQAEAREMEPSDINDRIAEGIQSLKWALENEDLVWVNNRERRLVISKQTVITLERDGKETYLERFPTTASKARIVGEGLLNHLRQMV